MLVHERWQLRQFYRRREHTLQDTIGLACAGHLHSLLLDLLLVRTRHDMSSMCVCKGGIVSLPSTPVSVSRRLPRGTCAALKERKHIVASRSRNSDLSKWPLCLPRRGLERRQYASRHAHTYLHTYMPPAATSTSLYPSPPGAARPTTPSNRAAKQVSLGGEAPRW